MSTATLQPGFRLGKYEVLAHVATGGMGSVYKAVDTELCRTVALKVLPVRLAEGSTELERFRREARHAARLNHLHIVTLFECGYDAAHDLHYLALEFIDGIDLEEHIRRKGRLPADEARRILIQAAKALDHAFERGVIHRDIKPSNFLLAQEGARVVVKLTDLGVARVADDDEFKVTREGTTVGTIDYMAPEQASDSRAADVRSDIYSLGCTAYHMLAGRPPFADGGLGERVFKHITVPPPDVRQFNPEVSADFWAVLQKMLAKKPQDRYATPAELLHDLQNTSAEAPDEKGTVPPRAARTTTESTQAPPLPGASQPVTASELARAAALYERALQVLAEGSGEDYAYELLTNCLKLDPFNRAYHQTLREVHRKAPAGVLGRLLGSLNVLAVKSRMRLARSSGEWRKVLEHGEDVLARQTTDVETHFAMAEAAAALGLTDLAAWFLEQGREQVPDNADLTRALARVQEKAEDWQQALALWREVVRLAPADREAGRKINDLAAEDHIARGNVRR